MFEQITTGPVLLCVTMCSSSGEFRTIPHHQIGQEFCRCRRHLQTTDIQSTSIHYPPQSIIVHHVVICTLMIVMRHRCGRIAWRSFG